LTPGEEIMNDWTLLSNHGHVLVCLSADPRARLRDVATDVGITERAVQKIVRDLQDGGMVSVTKNGRRNTYRIHKKKTLRHDLEQHCTLRKFITFVGQQTEARRVADPVAAEPEVSAFHTPTLAPKTERKEQAELPGKKSDKSSGTDSIERQQGSLF